MKNNKISKIKQYLNSYNEEWVFSGNVIISMNDEVLINESYGQSNIECETFNNKDTKFPVLSLTKAFTSTLILLLGEKGFLSINDSINKYLPEYPEFDERITLHHLMSHTSGITNYNNLKNYFNQIKQVYYSKNEFVDLFKNEPLEFEPGTSYSYSNSGYYLLGLIIEKVTGETFSESLHKYILEPLNMVDSGIYNEKEILKNRAYGYELQGDTLINDSFTEWTKLEPSGGLYTTTSDMLKWAQSILNKTLLSKENYKKVFTDYGGKYGYGWFIEKYDKGIKYDHNGSHNGYMSQITLYEDINLSIIIMCNHNFIPVWDLTNNIYDILVNQKEVVVSKPKKIEVSQQVLNKVLGEYEDPDDENIYITKENDKIYMQIEEPHKYEIYPISETVFHHILIDERYEFTDDGIILFGQEYKKELSENRKNR